MTYRINYECPCKGCDDRNSQCHANCEKYKVWKTKLDDSNATLRKKKDIATYDAHKELHSRRYNKKDYIWKK